MSYLLSDAEVLEYWARESICIMSSDEELEEDEIIDVGDNKHRVGENEEKEEDDANSENQAKVEETPSKAKAFACNFCQKTYTSKPGLDSHKAGSHLGDISCPAVGCEQRYTSIKGLQKHVAKIHKTGAFKCNMCDLSLDSYSLLKVHKQEHDTKKKKYTCRLECGRRFTLSGDHNKHETGPCPKINVKKRTLHTCIARQLSKFIIIECSCCKGFTITFACLPNSAKCSFCNETFESKALMHKHISKKHKRLTKYVCDVCRTNLQSQSDLIEHVKSHSLGRKHSKRNSCI